MLIDSVTENIAVCGVSVYQLRCIEGYSDVILLVIPKSNKRLLERNFGDGRRASEFAEAVPDMTLGQQISHKLL